MAANKCPNCSQVTISFGDESSIKCPLCEVVFEVQNDQDREKSKYGNN